MSRAGSKLKLVCYCCGEELGKTFVLFAYPSHQNDRVFVMKPEHTVKLDDEAASITVRRA